MTGPELASPAGAQQSAQAYLAHGQVNFFRLPVAPRPALLPPGTGAALLGVPFDGGATASPGARLAPWQVRRVSAFVQGWHPGHGLQVFERLRPVDAGNVVFPPFDAATVRARVEAEVASVARAGAVPFLVGGDHSIALPSLRALAQVHGPLAVVHLDAHLDTSGPEVWGEAYHHGSPIRHAIEEQLVLPGHLHQLGIRAPWGAASDGDLGRDHGATVLSAEEVAAAGPAVVARAIREGAGERPLYLTLDVDALDPAFAPGTGTPVPGGFSAREVIQLLRGLAGVNLVGMDLVEVCPALDHADLTGHLAAHLLFEGLALAALRRR